MEGDISKVFDQLIEVNEADIIIRKNCKLCNHSLRHECETEWEQQDFNYNAATQWINNQVKNNGSLPHSEIGMKFSIQNVRNHMKDHYKAQERHIRLKDYAAKIENLVNLKQDRAKMLEVSLAVCYENLAQIASAETFGDIKSEKLKSDGINKVVSQMLSVIELQSKIEGEIKSKEMVQEKFVGIWVDMINKEQSDAKKKILISMLERFAGEQT